MKENKHSKYYLVWILGLIYVLPIILADRYCNDDTQRVLYHNPGWSLDGRPLSDIVIRSISGFHSYIFDIFPLPLILSVLILLTTTVRWTEKILKTETHIGTIASLLPLTAPFYLANLSYRFDCITFSLSVVLLIIPFLIRTGIWWKDILIETILILLSMCLYQPTVGLFPGLVVLTAFLRLHDNEKPYQETAVSFASILIGTLAYKLVAVPLFVDKTGWRSKAGAMVPVSSMIPQIIYNVREIVSLIIIYLKGLGARQIMIYILIRILGGIALFLSLEKRKKLLISLLYALLPAFVFIVSVLPMCVLSTAHAHARYLTELISLMFVLGSILVMISKKWPRISLALGVLVILCHFSFAYTFGNAYRDQKEYADHTAQSIVRDIESLNDESINEIVITGNMPYSPLVRRTIELMPVLSDLIPAGIDGDGMLNGALINHYSKNSLSFVDASSEEREYTDSNTPFSKNLIYDIYRDNNRIYVRFK